MNYSNFALIILAAGKGTRMKARNRNKVAMNLVKKPMIVHILDWAKQFNFGEIIIIIGYKKDSIIKACGNQVKYVEQKKQLGTGHAVKTAFPLLSKKIKQIIIVYGDHTPFYTQKRIKKIIKNHLKAKAQITITTTNRADPTGYGRIIKNKKNQVVKIVEEANVTKKERLIKEVNAGCYCYQRSFLEKYLPKIEKNPLKGEYVLADLVKLATENNLNVNHVFIDSRGGPLGVNTRDQLLEANRLFKRKKLYFD